MRISPKPDDELLKSLVREAAMLPRAAAAQARAQQRARRSAVCIAAVMVVSLWGAEMWFSKRFSQRAAFTSDIAPTPSSPEGVKPAARPGYVKVYGSDEVAETNAIPPDASERERKLLTELPGIPLLIVRNDAGEVARFHIFER